MLEYDLTETKLAQRLWPPRVPSEGEELAILVALMLVEGCTFSELGSRPITLTADNLEGVARLIEERLTPFAPDTGSGPVLRERLGELVGLQISRADM